MVGGGTVGGRTGDGGAGGASGMTRALTLLGQGR